MDASSLDHVVRVAVSLNAVLAAMEGERPKVLCVRARDGSLSLPYGPFDPALHRTFEIGLREWVDRQTSLSLGYIEQLYTFGDLGREAPAAALSEGSDDRIISIGYLALAPKAADVNAADAQWRDWYGFFPWEDWRAGEPARLSQTIAPALRRWAASALDEPVAASRHARIDLAFGLGGEGWQEERTLDRYELMYEAGLVEEARRDRGEAPDASDRAIFAETGRAMISDHRRILATAIGRLRGKLKYRPVVFRLMPPEFTLLDLQKTVEAIVGFRLHKQNFRRGVETGGFVEKTGAVSQTSAGRPASLFRVAEPVRKNRIAAGLAIPRLRSQVPDSLSKI